MTQIASRTAEARLPLMTRLWRYQAERFPVFKHGLLIAAFGASAVCLSALMRGAVPSIHAILAAIGVLFLFFMQLRIADEHKDAADDAAFRPERAVPRGLITLKELRLLAYVAGVAQIAIVASLDLRLVGLLGLAWIWLGLMSAEFFVPDWLKARPLLYMLSHMMIMPLLDLLATACDWMPAAASLDGKFGIALAAFLALSMANGCAIEIARKCWAPEAERDGVETYSKLWGPKRAALAFSGAVLTGLILAGITNHFSGVSAFWLLPIMAVVVWALLSARRFIAQPTPRATARLETASGVFVLINYLALGVLPMGYQLWLA